MASSSYPYPPYGGAPPGSTPAQAPAQAPQQPARGPSNPFSSALVDDDENLAPLPAPPVPAAPAEVAPPQLTPTAPMATLRPTEPTPAPPSREPTLPGHVSAADTLVGGSRPSDIVDIPLDDLEHDPLDDAKTLIPGQAIPQGPLSGHSPSPTPEAEPRPTTATWHPPSFGAVNETIPLSPEAFHRLLPRFATVKSRDEITDLLLDFLAEGFSRVIMFVHVKGEIRGRDARGEDLLVEAVRQIRIPAGGPSVFSSVIDRRSPYFGPMRTDTPIDAAFYSALGGVEGVILVLPVIVRDKVPLLVFASGSSNPVDPGSLLELTNEVAAALERIIVVEKTKK